MPKDIREEALRLYSLAISHWSSSRDGSHARKAIEYYKRHEDQIPSSSVAIEFLEHINRTSHR